jgi:tetratricopeptide (TPR) repeat protein
MAASKSVAILPIAGFLLGVMGVASISAANFETASQLLQSTTVDRIMRSDFDKVSSALDELPDAMPAALRSELRNVVGKTIAYPPMRDDVAKALASRLGAAALDRNLRWWTSSAGSAIAEAELSAYNSITGGPISALYGRTMPSTPDSVLIREVVDEGGYTGFAEQLRLSVAVSRQCLLLTIKLDPDCDHRQIATDRAIAPSSPRERELDAIAQGYALIPMADVSAYLAYLRSGDAKSVLAVLRSSMLEVERNRLDQARNAVRKAIREYVLARSGDTKKALVGITATIDAGGDLDRARMALQLLRYADETNPAILVALARVALMRAPPTFYSDGGAAWPTVDAGGRAEAQQWLDEAHALEPRHPDTLALEGHLAYLNADYERSISLLEQARESGATEPWLRIDLANSLFRRGSAQHDKPSVQRAALELESALNADLPGRARADAYLQLANAYVYLGDVQRADRVHLKYLSSLDAQSKGYALQNYAQFLLYSAHDVDRALSAARAGIEVADFSVADEFLARVLMVKSDALFAAGQPKKALELVAEARATVPDLKSQSSILAMDAATYPGLRALHTSGVLKDFSGAQGGQALVRAAPWGGTAEIAQLIGWGANPNYLDPKEGTALQRAILADNVSAVKALLAHGADPTTRYKDGRLPTELTGDSLDSRRAEILALLENAARQRRP